MKPNLVRTSHSNRGQPAGPGGPGGPGPRGKRTSSRPREQPGRKESLTSSGQRTLLTSGGVGPARP